ncbi:glycosyltransferase family 4 protein [Acinetobacter sp. UBA1297]|uniref:glycosyltransferase family 4 protein n=1 Tax=Acinetobacter sp. UBA1297 TaxID=1945925 RepID=UPI002579EBF3|nr:glycosyltransferase family 4 protein [Acinetobacter sp. UBA1297]
MRFLIFGSHLNSIINFRGKLIDEIKNRGNEVHILVPSIDDFKDQAKYLRSKDFIIHTIPMQRTGTNPLQDIYSLYNLYKIFSKIKPDFILSYTIKPVIYGTLIAWLTGISYRFALITGLGYSFNNIETKNSISFFQKIIYKLYKFSLAKTDITFFQNIDDLKLFEKMELVRNTRVIVVNGSGVDLDHYIYNIKLLENSTEKDPLKFLMLGRIIGDKGIREYIAAARRLKQKYSERVVFQLAGGLDSNPTAIQKNELDSWIEEGIIEYLGKLKDVRPILTDSHVFILPSYREGTSRSILEAMSIGRPVVTTNVPGCKQLVIDGENGYLAEVKSVESLVNAIEKILQLSPEQLLSMGKASRQIVEDKYDVHKVNHHMLTEMGIMGENNV